MATCVTVELLRQNRKADATIHYKAGERKASVTQNDQYDSFAQHAKTRKETYRVYNVLVLTVNSKGLNGLLYSFDLTSNVMLQQSKNTMGKAIDFFRFIMYNMDTVLDEGWDFPLLY